MSDLIEFRGLKNLIAVVEEGNITRASKRLYISQPCLSGQMKQLEDALQVSLLMRDSSGVHATPAAEILIAGSRHLLKLRDDLFAMTREAHSVSFLPMRLGFSSFVDHSLFEMVCSIHNSLFPSCEIKSRSGDNVEILMLLEKCEIDAALLTLPVNGVGLKLYPFTQSRLVVCMRSHDRLLEMLEDVGIVGQVGSTNKTPHDLQWMVESSYGYALIREGSSLMTGLVTRPIAGVTWTVDSALILGRLTSQRTMPQLVKELRKRLRLQASLPPSKPPRAAPPSMSSKSLPLFG